MLILLDGIYCLISFESDGETKHMRGRLQLIVKPNRMVTRAHVRSYAHTHTLHFHWFWRDTVTMPAVDYGLCVCWFSVYLIGFIGRVCVVLESNVCQCHELMNHTRKCTMMYRRRATLIAGNSWCKWCSRTNDYQQQGFRSHRTINAIVCCSHATNRGKKKLWQRFSTVKVSIDLAHRHSEKRFCWIDIYWGVDSSTGTKWLRLRIQFYGMILSFITHLWMPAIVWTKQIRSIFIRQMRNDAEKINSARKSIMCKLNEFTGSVYSLDVPGIVPSQIVDQYYPPFGSAKRLQFDRNSRMQRPRLRSVEGGTCRTKSVFGCMATSCAPPHHRDRCMFVCVCSVRRKHCTCAKCNAILL